MRIYILILGFLILILGLFQGSKYLTDYEVLTTYGKGYVWGSVILVMLGSGIIIYAWKRMKQRA